LTLSSTRAVDIDRPMLPRALTGMQQHVLDDRVRALAVLHDFIEIATQRIGQLVDRGARFMVDRYTTQDVPQLIDQLGGDPRKIVDEIERILDLVRDAFERPMDNSFIVRSSDRRLPAECPQYG
jgi:hypothetical protein